MSEKIRVGIIGAGQISQAHLSAYSEIGGVEVIAIADINEEAATTSAHKFGVANFYTDFREILKRDDIQAVDVCLHNNFHAPVTIAALEAGKHVYCEKPMAGSYRDAQAMFDASVSCGRHLHIQLSTLYADETVAAKTLIEEGKLGEVYHARSTGFRRRGRPFVDGYGTSSFVQKRNSGGGALYDMGVYHIAQMLYLLGNPQPQRITGKTYQKIEMDEGRRADSGYDVEELGLGFVHFVNGLTLDIIESWAINLGGFEASSIVGTEGGIRLEPFAFYQNLGSYQSNSTIGNLGGNYNGHLRSQEHWVAALRDKIALLPTAAIGLSAMLISEGIYLSESLGREVTVEEVRARSQSTAVTL